MDYLYKHIWLILFLIWGFPLTYYRSKFRKIVYQTNNWTINFKPVFIKEIKALIFNLYPNNKPYLKFRNFYRVYLFIYLILFTLYYSFNSNAQNSKNMESLKTGMKMPHFVLKDQKNQLFHSDSVVGRKNLVIYFYPKDDSPGCTKQACSFRDQFSVFEDVDAIVIGISAQSVESHKKFAEKHRLTFTLLSDEDNKVRKLFGVPTNLLGILPGRVTYIIDKSGEVIYIFNSQLQAEKHVDEALRILKSL
jgi:peroxiredoxin Q/BCP